MQLFPFRHSHQIIFRFREDLNPHLSRSRIEIFALSQSENVPSPDATLLSRYRGGYKVTVPRGNQSSGA